MGTVDDAQKRPDVPGRFCRDPVRVTHPVDPYAIQVSGRRQRHQDRVIIHIHREFLFLPCKFPEGCLPALHGGTLQDAATVDPVRNADGRETMCVIHHHLPVLIAQGADQSHVIAVSLPSRTRWMLVQ